MKRRDFLIGTAVAASSSSCSQETQTANGSASKDGLAAQRNAEMADEKIEPAKVFPTDNISPVTYEKTTVVNNLLAPMRDGVGLATDLIRPDAPGAYPVVLMRTPYNKVEAHDNSFLNSLVQRGYIVAIQDCRGRFNSDGVFTPYRNERTDGYDAVEWIAEQSWCDGNVGMEGGSYAGGTQWFAAMDAPPHLKAIMPGVAQWDAFHNEPVLNGCLLLPMLEWMHVMGRRSKQYGSDHEWFNQDRDYFHALPIASGAEAGGSTSEWWEEWMDHPNLDDFWRSRSYSEDWRKIKVPALNITGWWDMGLPSSPGAFLGMRGNSRAPKVAAAQQMIIGPWPHWVNRKRNLNGVDFGEKAIVNLDDYKTRFLDRWLKGKDNGLGDDPRVQIFVLGANEWRSSDEWPLPETAFTPFYFHSKGDANSSNGGGVLSRDTPGGEPSDSFTYDPMNPTGVRWDLRDGPVDDRATAEREDVLCYTTKTLSEPLDVIGPVSCVLFGSSSALDTDWHVRLVDVHPNGEARYLCHGALRARFRNSFEEPELLEPNKIYKFDITMDACGIRFLPGHRIRIEVMSSWFPRYDRNMNSGAPNNFRDANPVVANNRIHHEKAYPSHLILPLVPTKG
ncbi:MAG: CocE/NonD family hydrolase [Pseudomonadota bacterium]